MLTMSFIDGFSEHFCYQIKNQSNAVTAVDVTFFVQIQVHKYFISYIVQTLWIILRNADLDFYNQISPRRADFDFNKYAG